MFFANRAACHLAVHAAAEAARDCDAALRIDSSYVKCYVRRAQAKEKLDKLDEALLDYKKANELGAAGVKSDIARLEPIVKERVLLLWFFSRKSDFFCRKDKQSSWKK